MLFQNFKINIFVGLLIIVFSQCLYSRPNLLNDTNKYDASVHKIFNRAIFLNENLKKLADSISLEKYQQLLSALESFHEDTLNPAFSSCVKYLSSGKDSALSFHLLKLLLSFENSADESLTTGFAEIYYYNPDLVEITFNKFDSQEKKKLLKRLLEGWLNFTYSIEKTESLLKKMNIRLNVFSSKISKEK
jgi:hypothetical protein